MERRRVGRGPPFKVVGLVTIVVLGRAGTVLYLQFRGDLTPNTKLTMVAARSGLVMDPGSKVTYNGVQIGRVSSISEITRDGRPAAQVVLDITPKYLTLIPANVAAAIKATTVFGNKYVALSSPPNPATQSITPSTVIDATSVTTEFNTLFETVTSIADKVDPVKVNLTLSAAAQALTGLGGRFGASLINGNAILDDVNPQMPRFHTDIGRWAALGDTYADAAPDLWEALDHAVTAARTLNAQQGELDAALPAAAGAGTPARGFSGGLGRSCSVAPRIWLPPANCSTSTAPKSFAPPAISMMWRPGSTPTSATTASRWGRAPRALSPGRPIRISGRRTCRGSTPGAGPVDAPAAGQPSLGNSGRPRFW